MVLPIPSALNLTAHAGAWFSQLMPAVRARRITSVGQGVAAHNRARTAVACPKLPEIAAVVDQ